MKTAIFMSSLAIAAASGKANAAVMADDCPNCSRTVNFDNFTFFIRAAPIASFINQSSCGRVIMSGASAINFGPDVQSAPSATLGPL